MELLEKDTITLWTRARATIPIYVKYSFFVKKVIKMPYQDTLSI